MRKPREFQGFGPLSFCESDKFCEIPIYRVWVGRFRLSVKQLRSFAAWLLKAADWLEEKEK